MPETKWYRFPSMLELLALIRRHEGGVRGYNADFRNDDRWDLINASFDQVRAWGRSQVVPQGEASSAIGGYQFLTATLDYLKKELALTGTEIMSPEFQDDLAIALMIRKRPTMSFMKLVRGEIGIEKFADGIAREWASMPVLYHQQGAHRTVNRGQSYYAGDGLNAALISATELEAVLRRVATEGKKAYEEHQRGAPPPPPIPEPEPVPPKPPKGVGGMDSTGEPLMAMSSTVVDVKSAWSSKINWVAVPTALIAFLAAIGLPVSDGIREIILMIGSIGSPLLIWIMRTWFTRSVTKASVGVK